MEKMTPEELDALVQRASDRHKDRTKEEKERERLEEERLRQAYLRRTGRKEMRP